MAHKLLLQRKFALRCSLQAFNGMLYIFLQSPLYRVTLLLQVLICTSFTTFSWQQSNLGSLMTLFKPSRELCSLIQQVKYYQKYTEYDHVWIINTTVALKIPP